MKNKHINRFLAAMLVAALYNTWQMDKIYKKQDIFKQQMDAVKHKQK